MADEVITGFGRFGEYFASARYGPAPDLITLAKGLTSAYAPMGAVLVSDRIAEPLYEEGRMLLHGITFAGHPMAAAIALRNIEIFEREGVLENVREHEGYLRDRLNELKDRVPIVGDVRGDGFFWALELVRDAELTRFSAEERERLLRGFLAGRLLEEGLIARPDDRGDAVLHLSPPLICGRRELDELVAKTEAVLERRLRALLRVIHDAHGYWLREAGGAEPVAPAAGDLDADVVIVGGGYAGMWTAWNLLDRGARVVLLEADVCGHGPSGRNGGFCETLWSNLPSLRERFGDERALAACEASSEQRARDRRLVRGGGRRRLVPAGRLRRDLDQRGAGRGDRRDPGRGVGGARQGDRARRGRGARPLLLAALPPRPARARRRDPAPGAARARPAPAAARARRRDLRALARARVDRARRRRRRRDPRGARARGRRGAHRSTPPRAGSDPCGRGWRSPRRTSC